MARCTSVRVPSTVAASDPNVVTSLCFHSDAVRSWSASLSLVGILLRLPRNTSTSVTSCAPSDTKVRSWNFSCSRAARASSCVSFTYCRVIPSSTIVVITEKTEARACTAAAFLFSQSNIISSMEQSGVRARLWTFKELPASSDQLSVTGSWRLDAGSYTINMMQLTLTILVCLTVFMHSAPLLAQQNERPVLQVTKLAEGKRPAIDGKVDEDSWHTAHADSTFPQQ